LIFLTTADREASLTTSSFLNRTILNPKADNTFSRQKSKDECRMLKDEFTKSVFIRESVIKYVDCLLPPFIFLFLQAVDIPIHFSPHPSSPKSDDLNFESAFRL
jgi:hypothetical protein